MTYYYVQRGGPGAGAGGSGVHAQRGYGTVAGSASASTPANQFPGQQNGTMPGARQYGQHRGGMKAGSSANGPPNEVPPTYAEAVKGDNKIQSHA